MAHHLRETSAERTESSSSMRSFFPPNLTIQPTQALRLRAPCLFTIMILSCVHKHTSPKCFSSRAGNFFHLPSLLFLPLPVATCGSLSPSSQSPRQMQKITAAPPRKTAVNYLAAREKHNGCVSLYTGKLQLLNWVLFVGKSHLSLSSCRSAVVCVFA